MTRKTSVCCSSVDAKRTILSSLVLGSCSAGPQMTNETNLRSEESLTVGTRYCGRFWRISGLVLSGLSSAFCSIHPTHLACLGTFVNSRPPLSWANFSKQLAKRVQMYICYLPNGTFLLENFF